MAGYPPVDMSGYPGDPNISPAFPVQGIPYRMPSMKEQHPGAAAAAASESFDPSGKYKIKFQGAFAAVEVAVVPQDGVKSEAGTLVSMSGNVRFLNLHFSCFV